VRVEGVEMDEMWSYVQNKGNQCWLWHAIDHETGDILAYTFGTQEDKVLEELLELLEEYSIDKFYTDGNPAYARNITPTEIVTDEEEDRLEAHEVGKTNTQKIERVHLSLRTWVKRLARKTICFSKTFLMHKIVVGLCINIKFFGRLLFA
jgi:insertion element IS1 protein InsB